MKAARDFEPRPLPTWDNPIVYEDTRSPDGVIKRLSPGVLERQADRAEHAAHEARQREYARGDSAHLYKED